MPNFEESQHPRDQAGKFTSGDGGEVSPKLSAWARGRVKTTMAEKTAPRQLYLSAWAKGKGEEGKLKAPDPQALKEGRAKRYWTTDVKNMPKETWMRYYDANPDKGGKLVDRDRQRNVHDAIMHRDLDKIAPAKPGEQKMAIFTMGGPASGKSSMMAANIGERFVHIDPDEIRKQLPEYKQVTTGPLTYKLAAAMTHEEASDLAKKETAEAVRRGQHVIVDGTGANAKSIINKMEKLRAAGYHIHLAYAHLGDPEEGVKRVAGRAETSARFVPDEVVRDAYTKIPPNFEEISKHADSFAVHDTSKKGSPVAWTRGDDGVEKEVDPDFVRGFRQKYFRGQAPGTPAPRPASS